ncbi:MAG: GNAT family N-acetyltransferase [Brevundimonas sp.]|uniref:GNAT family N-acetyltransferase n=1 Tax=Brevundimonas sp. TaxID=1871086 RepID=UPI00391B602B
MDSRWRIAPADFEHPRLLHLLRFHLDAMRRSSPRDSVHALDISGLRGPGVTLFALWEDDTLLAMGALRTSNGFGEIKSMRTHPDHLGRGAGRAMLEHLIAEAARLACRRVSLETGSGAAFERALNLYRRRGFRNGAAFGGYEATDFNQFLHLDLAPG